MTTAAVERHRTRDEIKTRAKEMFVSGQYVSFNEIARVLGIKRVDTLRTWAKQEGWEKTKNQLIDTAIAIAAQEATPIAELKQFIDQSVQEALVRHVGHAIEIQEKALQAIRGVPIRTLAEAQALLEYGVGLERVSRNLAPPGMNKSNGNGEGALSADSILAAFVKVSNMAGKTPVVVDKGRAEDATETGPDDGEIPPAIEASSTVVN